MQFPIYILHSNTFYELNCLLYCDLFDALNCIKMSKIPMLCLHISTLLTPPLSLALGFRGMPRTSPAGSTEQLCIGCYPLRSRPQSPPTSPAFPPPSPAKLGEVTRREGGTCRGSSGAEAAPGEAPEDEEDEGDEDEDALLRPPPE